MDSRPTPASLRVALLLTSAIGLMGAAAPNPAPGPTAIASVVTEATIALRRDAAQARRLAEQALSQLARQPDIDQEFRARLVLCEVFAERDPQAHQQQVETLQALQPRLSRTGLRAGLLTCRGERHEMLGDSASALTLYDQAVSAATSSPDDEMLAGALFSRGFIHSLQGNYAQGLADLRRSQALFDRQGLPLHALNSMNGIATAYNRMGDTKQALEIYTRALQTQRTTGLRRDQTVTEYNIGRVAERTGNWALAKQHYEAAYALGRELAYPRGEAHALRGLAAVAVADGKPRDALDLLSRARALGQEALDARRLRANIELTQAIALRALGDPQQARELLSRSLTTFREAGAQVEMVATYEQLALADTDLGDWRRAYQWQEAAKKSSEQLLRNQIDQHFAALKVEFDTATREKEYEALLRESVANQQVLEQSNRARKLQYAVSGLIVLLAGLLASVAWHHNRNSKRLRRLALTDELTGVPNRRAVLGLLPEVLQRPEAHGAAVLLIDIDHFKRINDTFGHATGDRVLKLVAERLRTALQPPEFFGRIGGEEFLVVVPGADLRAAHMRAESLRSHVCATDISAIAPELAVLTVSIGVANSRAGDSTSSILQRADAALYRAKASGRNRVLAEPATESLLQQAS